jgi:hypothetical protein
MACLCHGKSEPVFAMLLRNQRIKDAKTCYILETMKSALKKLLSLLLLASGNALGAPSVPEPSLQTLPLSELEQRLVSIDTELSNLANSSLRNGVGNLGWISICGKATRGWNGRKSS